MRFIQGVIFLYVMIPCCSVAQNIEKIGGKEMLAISGGANFSSIFYAANGIKERRDPYTWFLTGNLNLSVLDWSIPFSYSYSNQQGTFTQPFNQFSLSPQYKWIKSYLGFSSMTFSSYTLAGHVFAGAGLDLTPGNWRISAMYGRLNKPVPYDVISGTDYNMAYKRMGYGAKIGYEVGGHGINLVLFKASDDPTSLPFIPLNTQVTPKDNTVISVLGKTKLNNHFSINCEYALSGLTRNILSTEDKSESFRNKLPFIYTPRATSQFFSAYKSSFGYNNKQFNVQLNYERVAPDYQTLGAYFFNNDLENITLAPSVKLFQGKVNFALNSGFQRNNLDNTKLNTARRFVNAVNANFMIGKKTSVNISYSNFSSFVKNRPLNDPFFTNAADTLNFYQVSQNATGGASYNFGNAKIKQALLLSSSFQVTDQGSGTINQVPAIIYNGNLSYNLGWVPTKTNGTFSLNFNKSEMREATTLYWGPSLILSQTVMNGAVRLNMGSTFNQVLNNGQSVSNVINTRTGVNYNPKGKNSKYGKATLGVNGNYLKRLPTANSSKQFSELTVSVNLNYGF